MAWILLKVNNFSRALHKCGFFHTGVIMLLLIITELRSAKTNNDRQMNLNEKRIYLPNEESLAGGLSFDKKSDSTNQNWKPIQKNTTSNDRMYLGKVNVFESQKISNKSDVGQNITKSIPDKLPNLFRTLRLANSGRDFDSLADDNDDYSRPKKRYRHSKRVRIIKPPHFLVPPRKDEKSANVFENEARQFYRVYQTQYMKTPGYKSSEESEESSWKIDGDKDAKKRIPRIKKIRRKPINYLRPPVITLTTTEHIFFVKPKETTPMTFIDNNYPSKNEEDLRGTTTDRTTHNVTRSLDENEITLKPIKYQAILPTTTEIYYGNQTSYTPYPSIYNITTSSDRYLTPKTYTFANSPVTVYSMNDIFGLGGHSSNDWRTQHGINTFNDSRNLIFMMSSNNSERDGRYDGQSSNADDPPIQTSIETGGVYVVDPPNFSKDKEALWPATNYRNPKTNTHFEGIETGAIHRQAESTKNPGTVTSYRGPETTTNFKSPQTIPNYEGSTSYRNPGSTTSAYIYSDEVLRSSSYIPDDMSGFYVTNDYRTTDNKLSTLSGIQSGVLIHEINNMMPNTSSSDGNREEVPAHTESYFESTKMDNSLMSPEVRKLGMSVSKLELNPVESKIDGLHNWISRFNPEVKSFRSNGQNFGGNNVGGLDNSYDYQELDVKNPSDRQVKLHVAESGHFRKEQTVEKGLLLQQNNVIPGKAGFDYPILSKPPHTSRFMCKADGHRYVADVSSGCQVFYMCVGEGPGEPMLCPNGTLFSQDFLVCDWWYNVECRYK